MRPYPRIFPYQCDNGLPVYMVSMPKAGLTNMAFVARGGAAYEARKVEGIAHLLEHLILRGSNKRPSQAALALPLEREGGGMHAFTNEEVMSYFMYAPCDDVLLMCELLADEVLNPRFDELQNQIELEVAIEELRQYGSDPMEELEEAFLHLLFGKHRAGRPIVGKEIPVRGIGWDDVKEHHRSCFVSSNCVLFVAGRIEDRKALFAEINKAFSGLSILPARISKTKFSDSQIKPGLAIVDYAIPQTKIMLGVKCPQIILDDKYPLEVLKAILASGWNSRLALRLGEEEGLVYKLDIDFSFKEEVSYFAYVGGVKQENWQEAVRIILEEFARLKAEKVSRTELERAKRRILVHERHEWDDPESALEYLIDQWADNDEVSFKDETEGITGVTINDVKRVACKFFRDEALNLAVVGPHKGEERAIRRILHF